MIAGAPYSKKRYLRTFAGLIC